MSLPRFFLDAQVLGGEGSEVFPLDLSAEDRHHAKVLRLTPGEHIAAIDADGYYFELEIVDGPPKMSVRISAHGTPVAPAANVTLVQGMAKGDKMDAVIRQGTELGVSAFVPLNCSRSVVRLDERKAAARVQRWQTVAKSAAMQAGRNAIPSVASPLSVEALLPMLASYDAVVVFWEEASAEQTLEEALKPAVAARKRGMTPSVAAVVGPEGGLASDEVHAILSMGPHCKAANLGPYILRTETAGVLAPALTLFSLGGLGGAMRL